jgi:acetyl-CoA carboxylase carboxyltransferase component
LTTASAKWQLTRPQHGRHSIEPKYDIAQLPGIADPDIRMPLDMMEVLLRVVDDSRIELFKPLYGTGVITAWAHIHGMCYLHIVRGSLKEF